MPASSRTRRRDRPPVARWGRRLAVIGVVAGTVGAVRAWLLSAATRELHERHGPPSPR